MRTVEEHLAEILDHVGPLPEAPCPLAEAAGRVLAVDAYARLDLPGFDNSAMDGYAVRAADIAVAGLSADVDGADGIDGAGAGVPGGRPVTLPVTADIPAGALAVAPLPSGTAARIMTGAPLPAGADAIVPLEWTDQGIETVTIRRAAPPGLYVRRRGEDVTQGSMVLPAGSVLGAAQIALLAAVNIAEPVVHPRPRVAVLSTGSELVELGQPVEPGQIVDSNGPSIAVAVAQAGGIPIRHTGMPDDPDMFAAALPGLLAGADALITTGGVSVGAYDVVKQVLTGTGSVRFSRIAMQPGKPQGFGLVDGVPVFTLPGNPVSALVSFELFVRPALARMAGLPVAAGGLPTVDVVLAEEVRSPPGRRSYPRARLRVDAAGRRLAELAGGQGSHQISTLAAAHALLVVPEDVRVAEAGTVLPAIILPEAGALPGGPLLAQDPPTGGRTTAGTAPPAGDADRAELFR
jgi:molybdopterin molybdotransferase